MEKENCGQMTSNNECRKRRGPRKLRKSPLRYGASQNQCSSAASALNASKKKRRLSEAKDDEDVSYTLLRKSGRVSDWDDILRDLKAVSWICPVNFFSHAPLAKQWKNFAISKIGSKIELPYPRQIGNNPVYSVATIINFAGYKALVSFETSGSSHQNYYAWISYCSDVPKPLGYSLLNDYVVLPMDGMDETVPFNRSSHQQFVEKIYAAQETDSNSIDDEFEKTLGSLFDEYDNKLKFKLNDLVEVMDKEDPVQNCMAVIIAVVGDRIQVRYLGRPKGDQGFCFNVKSELVHPLGWSHAIGQILTGIPKHVTQFPTLSKKAFPAIPSHMNLQPGMVFEVRHPFFPFKIATGTVKNKLKHGHFVARIETNNQREVAEFVFHVTSEYILPCGFCSKHNIELEKPAGEDDSFSWATYFEKKQVRPLIKENVSQKKPHNFVKGCKLEAIDVFEPMYLGPATVLNVADHLLYIHFDGWPRSQIESFQWISAFSGDIYPAGWSELVTHRLQGHAERPFFNDSVFIVKRDEINKDANIPTSN